MSRTKTRAPIDCARCISWPKWFPFQCTRTYRGNLCSQFHTYVHTDTCMLFFSLYPRLSWIFLSAWASLATRIKWRVNEAVSYVLQKNLCVERQQKCQKTLSANAPRRPVKNVYIRDSHSGVALHLINRDWLSSTRDLLLWNVAQSAKRYGSLALYSQGSKGRFYNKVSFQWSFVVLYVNKDISLWFKWYAKNPVSYTHLDVYKRQVIGLW